MIDRLRLVFGFLAAPLMPALLFGMFGADGDGGGIGMIIFASLTLTAAYIQMFVVGLPAWIWAARGGGKPSLRKSAAVGALTAGAPWLVVLTLNLVVTEQFGFKVWVNVGLVIAALVVLGAIGGVVAWTVAYWQPRQPASATT